jgi:hypothetical protein
MHVKLLPMNVQALPIPNPGDWLTIDGAAMLLGRSKKQVIRYVADQRIRGYRIDGAGPRLADRLLWRAEVEAFRDAQQTVRRPPLATRLERRAQTEGR